MCSFFLKKRKRVSIFTCIFRKMIQDPIIMAGNTRGERKTKKDRALYDRNKSDKKK